MKEYYINLFYSEDDGGWIADIPDLVFCSAFGPKPEEAIREVLLAREAWLAAVVRFRSRSIGRLSIWWRHSR